MCCCAAIARARSRPSRSRSRNHAACTTRSSRTCARAGASFLVAIEQAAAGAPRARRVDRGAVGSRVGRRRHERHVRAAALARRAPTSRRRASAHARVRRPLVARRVARPDADRRPRASTRKRPRCSSAGASRAAPGARADDLPGGFAAIGDVLRAMEDAGTVRRGYFVESLEGAQFAWPGAIDRLREAPRGQAPRVDVLAAVDPANAWGSALPWPPLRDRRRAAGAPRRRERRARRRRARAVGRAEGQAASRPRRARRPRRSSSRSPSACRCSPRRQRRRELLVETIDGEPAGHSPLARPLLAAGARVDYRGLVVRGTTLVAPPPSPSRSPTSRRQTRRARAETMPEGDSIRRVATRSRRWSARRSSASRRKASPRDARRPHGHARRRARQAPHDRSRRRHAAPRAPRA